MRRAYEIISKSTRCSPFVEFKLNSEWETVWLPLFSCCYCFFSAFCVFVCLCSTLLCLTDFFFLSFVFVLFFVVCYTFLTIFHHFFNKYIYPCAFSAVTVFHLCSIGTLIIVVCDSVCTYVHNVVYMSTWLLNNFPISFHCAVFFLGHDYNNTHECLAKAKQVKIFLKNIPGTWFFELRNKIFVWQFFSFSSLFDSTQWENVIFRWGFHVFIVRRVRVKLILYVYIFDQHIVLQWNCFVHERSI